jgi:hypothetical protein
MCSKYYTWWFDNKKKEYKEWAGVLDGDDAEGMKHQNQQTKNKNW